MVVIILGIYSTQNIGQSSSEKSYSKSTSYLKRYLRSINVTNSQPVKSNVSLGSTSLASELPEISEYDLIYIYCVRNKNENDSYIKCYSLNGIKFTELITDKNRTTI